MFLNQAFCVLRFSSAGIIFWLAVRFGQVKMVSLGYIAAVLSASLLCAFLGSEAGDVASSICSTGNQTLFNFSDQLLVGGKNFSFSQEAGKIVLVTNVASF